MSIIRMRKSFAQILKPLLIMIAAVFFISIFFSYNSNIFGDRGEQDERNEKVAVVNGIPITQAEFYAVLRRQHEASKGRGGTSAIEDAGLKSSLLQQFIAERLRVSAAQKQDVKISRREIARERQKMIDEQIEQIRTAVQGDGKNKLSDKELDLFLSRQDPPQTIKSLRKEMQKELTNDIVRQQLMVQKMEDSLRAKVGKIDDERLKESYRQVKVRQIVIDVDPTPDAQAKRKAEEVLKKIKAGEDFTKLAGEFSDDTFTKERGGDLGFMPTTYDKDLQNLKVGEVSGVLQTSQGYRIVKIEDSKLELPSDFGKKKKEYREQLKMTLENQELGEFYQNIEKTAKVEVLDPELKGYWLADKAQRAPTPAEREKLLTQATASLRKATRENADLASAYTKLAMIYAQQQKMDQAVTVLVDVLDGRRITEGADLRLMLAQMYIQKGDKEKAQPQLELASEMAYDNPGIHYQLQSMYKMVGQPELAAKEEQWIEEYSQRMQVLQSPPEPPKKAEKPATKKGG